MTTSKYLPIYLNDHLAGATGGVELARRLASNNEDHESGQVLREIAIDIAEDRESLKQIMHELSIGKDRIKPVIVWALEKVGRLKPNGELLSYSPLSRLFELEGLAMGVEGKLSLWHSLERALGSDRLNSVDLSTLIGRAESQRLRLETLRRAAAAEALA